MRRPPVCQPCFASPALPALLCQPRPGTYKPPMILITGGAGFIGSNLHAALYARGEPAIVVDWLGDGAKWRNLAAHPPAQLIPPKPLMSTSPPTPPRPHLPPRCHQRDHRNRRRPRLAHQRRALLAPLAMVRPHGHPVHICQLRRHLRQRPLLRRRPGRAPRPPPPQPLRLDQARLRPARPSRNRPRRTRPPAMGRPQVLQRLRPQRVP